MTQTERSAPRARGATLVEVLVAMCVTLVGAVGVVNLNALSLRYVGDGRRMTRATVIAQDLASQIELWGYTDPRLANTSASNDDNIGDVNFALETSADPLLSGAVDHAEADLLLGTGWQGIPAAALSADGYQRYWTVSTTDPANPGTLLDYNLNGVEDAKRIAIVVRWPQGTSFRRIVLLVTKPNPAEAL
jgi:Tfp pilus assembly protein PilV